MSRPVPTVVVHCTAVEHLPTVIARGLVSDVRTRAEGLTTSELGDPDIKERRRRRAVSCGPRGYVGEYVPFYFAPQNSMMYSLHKDGRSFDDQVFLVTRMERLTAAGCDVVVSNRNAADGLARFAPHDADLDEHVDWQLMQSDLWGWSAEDPDRPSRRMAECLAHDRVPWLALDGVVAKNDLAAGRAREIITQAGLNLPVTVRRGWYF